MLLFLTVALMSLPPRAHGVVPQNGLTGTWKATVPDVVRNEDGVQTVERTTTATLQLTQHGDSITGTIRRATSSVTRPLAGVVRGSDVTFIVETRARANVNGVDHELRLHATYRLRWQGDTLRGTSETRRADPKDDFTLPGVEQDPLPVVAVRDRQAAPPPPERAGLTPGEHRYRLVQRNVTQISEMSSNTPFVEREFLLTMQVARATDGQFDVFIRVDSATMDAAGKRPLRDAVGAGWKGHVTADGRRLAGGLVTARGEPSNAAELSPLTWMLPLFAHGASDTLVTELAAGSGTPRRMTAVRRFASDSTGMVVDGTVSTAFVGTPMAAGKPMQVKSSGSIKGRWSLTPNGSLGNGTLEILLGEQFTLGATTILRDDTVTWTLSRLG